LIETGYKVLIYFWQVFLDVHNV